DVGPRFYMAGCGLSEQFKCGIVENFCLGAISFYQATMPMAHVFTQADVRNHQQFWQFFFQQSNGTLYDAMRGVRARRPIIFSIRDTEQEDCRNASLQRKRSLPN